MSPALRGALPFLARRLGLGDLREETRQVRALFLEPTAGHQAGPGTTRESALRTLPGRPIPAL
jgi:hypothetical protein